VTNKEQQLIYIYKMSVEQFLAD